MQRHLLLALEAQQVVMIQVLAVTEPIIEADKKVKQKFMRTIILYL